MANKLKPPPLPPRRAHRAGGLPRSTQEVQPAQILSEEPTLDALAEPHHNRRGPPTAPPVTARTARGATVEVDPLQVVAERPATGAVAAVGQRVIYERVQREVPQAGLTLAEKMLLSAIDGRRDVQVIGRVSGIAPDQVQRVLDSLERRSLVARRS